MAFKACFGDIKIVSINIDPDFDHYNDLMVDVKIIYDDKGEQLIAPDKVCPPSLSPAGRLSTLSASLTRDGTTQRR